MLTWYKNVSPPRYRYETSCASPIFPPPPPPPWKTMPRAKRPTRRPSQILAGSRSVEREAHKTTDRDFIDMPKGGALSCRGNRDEPSSLQRGDSRKTAFPRGGNRPTNPLRREDLGGDANVGRGRCNRDQSSREVICPVMASSSNGKRPCKKNRRKQLRTLTTIRKG